MSQSQAQSMEMNDIETESDDQAIVHVEETVYSQV